MNIQFKEEFKKLNPKEIKDIINACAGQDILEQEVTQNLSNNYNGKYFIKYMEDENYGFWTVQWGWKKATNMPINMGTGFFEYSIKITPFRIEFENQNISNPFCKYRCRKSMEEHIPIYINKKCPHYKQAIMEQAQSFVDFLGTPNNDDEMTK